METSQANESVRTYSYSAKDFRDAEGSTYNNHTQKEIQAIADSSLNNVLLGLSGSLDPPPRYVGLSLGDIPLTNVNEEFSADSDLLPAHQIQGSHNGEVPFPLRVPHGLDENNQLMMQELQILHQAEKQQQQCLRIFQQSVEQQHHQQNFHRSGDHHHVHQQLHSNENETTGANQNELSGRQKGRTFSYVGVDQKGAGFLTAWEESVKYMDNLRQLQDQHVQQQQQQKNDQFCLNNMPLEGSGPQSITNFDAVHQENAFPRDKLPANNVPSDFLSLPQPPHLTISTSTSCSGLGFPESSVSVQSPGPTNRKHSSGPLNSSHSPGNNPFGYNLLDKNSSSHFFGTNDLHPQEIPYVGLSNKLMNFNSVPCSAGGPGAFTKFLNSFNSAPSGGSAGLFSVDLPIKPAYIVDQELPPEYIHRNEPRDVFGDPAPPHGHFLQEVSRRSKSSTGRLLGELEAKPLHHFATERQRREHLNEKYQTLRSLVPNPTKADRASIVSDAINRIHELKKQEENFVAEKKDREGRKTLKLEMRNNGKRPRVDGTHMDQKDAGEDITLKTQWIRKVSKHDTEVEIRILCDEVEVHIKQMHTPKFLIRVMTAIEVGLKLRVLDGNGGVIKDCDIYRFRLKMKRNSCTFLCIGLMASKILEILDAVF